MKESRTTASRGRPRAFDREAALRRAMAVFWERGYEGTSTADLCAALGIGKPSLYAAFGNKEALFREAVAYYDRVEGAVFQAALDDAPTARAAVEAVLRESAVAYCAQAKPRGCMIVLAALIGASENAAVREFLTATRAHGHGELQARIARGQRDGDVPQGADPDAVAAFYTTVRHGLSIQARDGASAATLGRIVDGAMAAWDPLVGAARPRRG